MDILDENSTLASQPEGIKLKLKPHQLASLNKMIILDKECTISSGDLTIRSNLGILADFPGYGKTMTMLSLITANKNVKNETFILSSVHSIFNYGIIITVNDKDQYINSTLIVIPDNLVDHWSSQLRFTELSWKIVLKPSLEFKIDKDVILCPASKYNSFMVCTNPHTGIGIKWNRVVFDEADSIYIPSTAHVSTRFLWCITGTFNMLSKRKNRGFLKDIFYEHYRDLMDKYYQHIVIKCDDNFVKKSFDLPIPNVQILKCLTCKMFDAIHNFVNPKIMEMISANDINNAILALGGNVAMGDDNIVNLVTKKVKKGITRTSIKLDNLEALFRQHAIKKENYDKRKKELKEKLKLLEERETNLISNIKNSSEIECPICYENLDSPVVVPCCSVMFCGKCVLSWLKTNVSCPLCRTNIEFDKLVNISKKSVIKEKKLPTKLEMCMKIVSGTGKYIIFSSHNESFREIEEKLIKKGIKFGTLTTNLKTEKTLDNYKNGNISVVLLNTNFNGAGLDLHQTTDIIIFHEMNKNLELQLVGRAQRVGRKDKLNVWKLAHNYEYAKND